MTFLRDDFGGFQFFDEIVEILDLAKKNSIKDVEFNLIEYKNENSSDIDSTKFLCNYTSDSTLEIVKYFSNGKRCFLWKYHYTIKYNIYILDSTLYLPKDLTIKFNCDDTNEKFKQKFKSDWGVSATRDTTIIQIY
ncbi:MAG: hypothetical protein WD512_07115, partial [Candidatus Paceibacterota bacterium]